MSRTPPNCPICFTPMTVRDVAPCHDCGAFPQELEHLAQGIHVYREYEVLGHPLILCNFCDVDFGSYDPTYFGRLPRERVYLPSFQYLRDIENPSPGKDHYCPTCNRRRAFLEWLAAVRAEAGS